MQLSIEKIERDREFLKDNGFLIIGFFLAMFFVWVF